MIRVFAISLCWVFLCSSQAQEDNAVFASANADFEKGEFASASRKYFRLAENGLISPDLFFNLGTALYREGKPGEAMLWMRRAEVVRPGMPEAQQNIRFLRDHLGFLEFGQTKIDLALRSLPPTFGKWLFYSALWLGLIAVAAAFCIVRLRPNRSGLITLAVVCFMFALVGNRITEYSKTHLALENFATITADSAAALTSPTPDAESVIDLPAGSEVRILQVAGKWIYADLPGELRGWIRREHLEQVWPISFKTS